MGVKIVKGIAGQYEALRSPANQINQQQSSTSASFTNSYIASNSSEATVNHIKNSGKNRDTEKLNYEKARKIADELGDAILNDKETALSAVGEKFSFTGVRDAFGL